jgi:hypothetical protein
MESYKRHRFPACIGFRATVREKNELDRLATEKNETPSEFLRNTLKTILSNGNKEETTKEE